MMADKLGDIADMLKSAYPPDYIAKMVGGGIKTFWGMDAGEETPTAMKVAQDITSLMLFSIPDPVEREKAATAMIPLLLRLVKMAEVVEEAEEEEDSLPKYTFTPPLRGNVYGAPVAGPLLSAQNLANQARTIAQAGNKQPTTLVMGQAQLAAYQQAAADAMSQMTVLGMADKLVSWMGGMPVVVDSSIPPGEVYVQEPDGSLSAVMRVRAEELAGLKEDDSE